MNCGHYCLSASPRQTKKGHAPAGEAAQRRSQRAPHRPIAALFYRNYLASFDRILRHARAIALSQQKPDFRIKARKLDRAAAAAEEVDLPSRVDSKDFLHRRQMEDYM